LQARKLLIVADVECRVEMKIFVFVFSRKFLFSYFRKNGKFSRKPSREQQFFAKAKIFAKRNIAKLRGKLSNFRLFSLFAKMKKGFCVSTLVECSAVSLMVSANLQRKKMCKSIRQNNYQLL
jgi:hypothetical protein